MSDTSTLDEQLRELGFREVGRTRGRPTWVAGVNRFLEFTLHDEGDTMLVTWRLDLGEAMLARGWQIGGAESASQELYPRNDVRVRADLDAVQAEIRRVLAQLRIDLGAPDL